MGIQEIEIRIPPILFMNKKFKQWWSTILPISTKRTSYLSLWIIEYKQDHDIWR